jgi:hypothetical protein
MRYAAYLQAVYALNLLLVSWLGMIIASSQELPVVGEDLLSDKYFDAIANHLDLDKPSGIMETTWMARASAAGLQVKEAVGRILSRYSAAISPEIILKCTAFENSGMVNILASLVVANTPFAIKGTTMQRPFVLTYAKGSVDAVRECIAMTHDMSKEFESEKGYIAPSSFLFSIDMANRAISKLSSAYVE